MIKIDIEGYELKVLLAIANALPSSLNVTIVFENWDTSFDLIKIKNAFKNRSVSLLKLQNRIIGTNKSKLRKYFEFILFGDKTELARIEGDDTIIGDIVLMLK